MYIGNIINYNLSGFYDNGGEYIIHLIFKNKLEMDESIKKINKDIKNINLNKEIKEEDLKIVLKSKNIQNCFNLLKKELIDLKLETL